MSCMNPVSGRIQDSTSSRVNVWAWGNSPSGVDAYQMLSRYLATVPHPPLPELPGSDGGEAGDDQAKPEHQPSPGPSGRFHWTTVVS